MSDESAWPAVAIVALIALVVTNLAVVAVVFLDRRRSESISKKSMDVAEPKVGMEPKQAWPGPDPELGDCSTDIGVCRDKSGSLKLAPGVRLELCEALRGLLVEEISRGLQQAGISDRLDRLEKQVLDGPAFSPSMVAEPPLSGNTCLGTTSDLERQLPVSSSLRDAAAAQHLMPDVKVEPAAPSPPPWSPTFTAPGVLDEDVVDLQQPSIGRRDSGINGPASCCPEPPPPAEGPPPLAFGPSFRQRRQEDPPERCATDIEDQESSLKYSLATVQKVLARRDEQTSELHRQLRQCQQECWKQSMDARSANKRLQDLLTDPSRLPEAQVESMRSLQERLGESACDLAEARSRASHWEQRARQADIHFMNQAYMSNYNATQVCATVAFQKVLSLFHGDVEKLLEYMKVLAVREHPADAATIARETHQIAQGKHAAGDIFIAAFPLPLPSRDEDFDVQRAGRDIGTSHLNPYTIDSWPFEANVLAQRTMGSAPNLGSVYEDVVSGSEDDDSPSCQDYDEGQESDDGIPSPPAQQQGGGHYALNLQQLPRPPAETLSDSERSAEPRPPLGGPAPLPPSDTARSV